MAVSRWGPTITALLLLLTGTGMSYAAVTVPAAVYADSHAQGLNKLQAQIAWELARAGVRDTDSTHWAAGSLTVLLQAGLLAPDPEGRLAPEEQVAVSAGVAVFSRVLGIAAPSDPPEAALDKAVQTGLVDRGAPGAQLTRLGVAHLLAKALGVRPHRTISRETYPFADFDLVSEADAALLASLYDLGIFRGYEDRTFRPGAALTRAQLAVLVDRILGAYGG